MDLFLAIFGPLWAIVGFMVSMSIMEDCFNNFNLVAKIVTIFIGGPVMWLYLSGIGIYKLCTSDISVKLFKWLCYKKEPIEPQIPNLQELIESVRRHERQIQLEESIQAAMEEASRVVERDRWLRDMETRFTRDQQTLAEEQNGTYAEQALAEKHAEKVPELNLTRSIKV